ncbi:phosphoglycerate dehydrogenase [Simiduia curdlanivorans]|uniref:Phosphoglycerate dehydrogenase n=1 Tax=Simiduia curdlanivorans TaxID=1492769 RepID=A0ABV8V8X8_9GAMM|nr:phosphoglycerate dehydrogenase [Simiduia curdlanivorans]MDN3639761.1 phosphoglycerate dehydrogenase [Simiduia curdlanivorans]
MSFKVQTFNQIAERGLKRFDSVNYLVGSDQVEPDAILLRSQNLHDCVLNENLKAIARAGAGVNNVPVDACSKQGIVVFNTPGANANAVKELVLCALLLASRGIVDGMQFAEGLTDIADSHELAARLEKEKKQFAGVELYGKKLGIVGLGAIGSMVAEMALALGMDVLGFDPALSVDAAWRLPNQVQRMESLQALLGQADYVSLHVPAIEQTKNLINADTVTSFKKGAVLVNFARESIVDPHAVLGALDKGGLARYVCDFPEPEFRGRKDVLAMPHIGASTLEAEENCAVMAADQLRDYLENGNIKNSVNFPSVAMPRALGTCRLTFTNDNVSGVLGHVLSVLADLQVNVVDMMNKSRGQLAYNIIDMEAAPSAELRAAVAAVEHVIAVRLI